MTAPLGPQQAAILTVCILGQQVDSGQPCGTGLMFGTQGISPQKSIDEGGWRRIYRQHPLGICRRPRSGPNPIINNCAGPWVLDSWGSGGKRPLALPLTSGPRM